MTYKKKSDVPELIKSWKAIVEKESGSEIHSFRTDGGGELCSGDFEKWMREQGIIHEVTPAHTPEMNGVSERLNRTLVESIRAMLDEADMSPNWWAEALMTANYVKNRSPTNRLGPSTTPYEAYKDHKPDLSHLRVFGSKVWVHVPKANRKKLDDKAVQGRFVGYGSTPSLYRVAIGNRVSIYRDVRFEEINPSEDSVVLRLPGVELENITPRHAVDTRIDESVGPDQDENDSPEEPENLAEEEEEIAPIASSSGSATPARTFPKRSNRGLAERFDDLSFPLGRREKYRRVNVDIPVPTTYLDAVGGPQCDKWKASMDEEIASINENNTWILVPDHGQKTVKCRWVYTKKLDGRFKSRLVAKGYTQRHGIDYTETFAPVCRMATHRVMLSLVAFLGLDLDQMDVVTAFLNGLLSETIYMELPDGYKVKGMICRLLRSLYGLKQSPRLWYQRLDSFLLSLGFKRSTADPCLYVRGKCWIAIHVDDLSIAGERHEIDLVKDYLSNEFKMKDLGTMKTFLGL
jgi:hypothetical protein